jgi:hypothetical protein
MLTYYAGRGTRIGLLNHSELGTHLAGGMLRDALGQRFSILPGEIVSEHPGDVDWSDFEIDVRMLPSFLADLLS